MNANIIKQAEELKNKITDAVDDIRDSALYIDALEKNKDKMELAFQGAGQTIYLSEIMSKEQMAAAIEYVMGKISDAQAERETRLRMLLESHGKPTIEPRGELIPTTVDKPAIVIETQRKQISGGTKKNPIPEDQEEEYLRNAYIRKNMKVEDIGKELGVGKTWIYSRIKKYGLGAEKEGAAVWSNDDVKKLLKSGKTVKEIAEYYGMSKKEAYEKMAENKIVPSIYKQKDR